MTSFVRGVKRILNACRCSADGFVATFRSEAAFRQDLLFCTVFTVVAVLLPASLLVKAFLLVPLFLILAAELVNTAIETVIDRISAERHPLSKKAKDIGSLLVLLSFVTMAVVWILTLFHLFG